MNSSSFVLDLGFLPAEYLNALFAEAADRGVSPEFLMEQALLLEARRLYYVQRSKKPKEIKPKRSVGRPGLDLAQIEALNRLLENGMEPKDVANTLGISLPTCKKYVKNSCIAGN